MPLYQFRCSLCGVEMEDFLPLDHGPVKCACGDFMDKVYSLAGVKVAVESTPQYNKWFHSEAVQSKLRSGEYSIMGKSHDLNHE